MRNKQGITIAALIIAIIGLSIGFAAFSNTLTIRSSATVNPDSSALRVVFSLDDDSEDAGTTGSVTPDSNTYGDAGTINNATQGQSLISGLHAKFTEPGQSVKYNVASANLYVYNAGSLQAQLTGVTFNNAQGVNTYKKCTAVTENKETSEIATDSLVQAACADITISVKVGNKVATPQDTSLNYQILNVGASLPAEITITYGGSTYVDGDFEVEFGDVVINATSAVNPALVPQPAQSEYSVGDVYNGDYISTTAGVLTGYRGSSTSIVIPETLPVVESTSTTFSISRCTVYTDVEFCTEAEKYYRGEENSLDSNDLLTYNALLQYITVSTYTITNPIPQPITVIADYIIAGMDIDSLTFSNNITNIGIGSFNGNLLTQLDIPSSVVNIGDYAFEDNEYLTSVRIHNNESNVQIGNRAFDSGIQIEFNDKTITYGE